MKLLQVLILVLAVFYTGCGYQFGQGALSSAYPTVCVPYVVGDQNGELTSEIIKEISRAGTFKYQSSNASLTLYVCLIDQKKDNIGFRFDRDRKGELTDSIIPTETRITACVEISVIETCTGCCLLGPTTLSESVDFDHDYYFSRDAVNIFSLGQLTDYDAALDAVQRPLNRALAEKIVQYLNFS